MIKKLFKPGWPVCDNEFENFFRISELHSAAFKAPFSFISAAVMNPRSMVLKLVRTHRCKGEFALRNPGSAGLNHFNK